jgi:SPP1 gp7 family putative phage head morphogenesis protein
LAEHEATLRQTLPAEYVTRYMRNRMPPLAGIVDQHLISATRDIAAGISERGFGVRESMRALQTQFPSFTDWRLENIARTEGAVLYETGHLARYRSDAAVQGIRFDAIRDSRTSEICLAHDGKCWRLSDPNLPAPPLHYMCRSTLTPVLFDEQPNWQDGPLGEDAQPLAGFGRVNESLLPPNVLLPY